MRGKQARKRKISPDVQYNNVNVQKFINHIMRKGKKSVSQNIVYKSFDIIRKKTSKEPLAVFNQAVKNVSPILEVISRRIGGANYQIPVEVKSDRRLTLAMKWIVEAAKSRKGKPMRVKLAEELIDAANRQGAAIKKREDVHRMADANKAFAHFA